MIRLARGEDYKKVEIRERETVGSCWKFPPGLQVPRRDHYDTTGSKRPAGVGPRKKREAFEKRLGGARRTIKSCWELLGIRTTRGRKGAR